MDRFLNWFFGRQDGAFIVLTIFAALLVLFILYAIGPSSLHQPIPR